MIPRAGRSLVSAVLLAAAALAVFPAPAAATWSILAVDMRTGRIVIASATCVSQANLERFPSRGLMDIQAIVVPGVGVAAAQAGLDRTRRNQALIYRELKRGTSPERILEMLQLDPNIEARQFGIVDLKGRTAAFSGMANGRVSLARGGRVPGTDIYFSIQGNILASQAVVADAVQALLDENGTLEDRVMAAMEAADEAGGDRRCSCLTEPLPESFCQTRHAQVAYLLAAGSDDPEGRSFNDGRYDLFINVTDENIGPDDSANPVVTLRRRYEAITSEGATPDLTRPEPPPA